MRIGRNLSYQFRGAGIMGYEITQYHKSSYMCIEEWGGHDFQLHFHAEIELSLILHYK